MNKTIHVLVIEDDEWFAQIIERELSKGGCRVTHVKDGIAAILSLDEQIVDVIFLDIFLPGPNGIVLLHEIHSHADLAKIPVIVCSGSAGEIPTADLEPYGVRRVLDKESIIPGDLMGAVRNVLQ